MTADPRSLYHQIRWTAEKLKKRLYVIGPLAYRRRLGFPPFRYRELDGPRARPPVEPGADDADWPEIPWSGFWGRADATFCLRTTFQIPEDWAGEGPLALLLPIGEAGDFSHPDCLVYVDGQPLASCDRHHQEVRLPDDLADGRPHTLALHGWAGGAPDFSFSEPGVIRGGSDIQLRMKPCQVVQVDSPTRELIARAWVALGTACALPDDDPTRAHLFNALDEAFKQLDTLEPLGEGFYASVPVALAALREGIGRAGAPLDADVTAVGHAHIDVAWLWTLDQTRHKAGRTFYNAIRLMEQFPDFYFTQSQPQLYDYVRQGYPALFEAIRQRVADGRWEALGGMWVEADCNLSGPESLARQLLLGQTSFREQFGPGAASPVLWLPDVFGYAWSLPQLIREAGLEYFFTIKIGWSQYNRLPYDSFWWQGLDGTRVLTHFSPTREGGDSFASTYNAMVTPAGVRNTWTNFQQKDWGTPGVTPPLLMAYGFGDGGGGPTHEMLENLEAMDGMPGLPRVRPGRALDFFRSLEATVGDRLPTWNGELYLEYHRGTYTTQARNKRANRKSEFLLHDAEFLAAMAATLVPGYAYPHQELRQAWETVCLNQFHDIIPGSSITAVYAESQAQYAEVAATAENVRQGAMMALTGARADDLGGELWVVNPTSFPRRDLALWPGGQVEGATLQSPDGGVVATQPTDQGLLLDVGEAPPYSLTPLRWNAQAGRQPLPDDDLQVSPRLLENRFLRVEFDDAGDIVRLYDKEAGREVLPPGAVANQLQIFEDRPKTPDSWEIDIYYDDRMWGADPAHAIAVVEAGPLRAALEIRRTVRHSEWVQRISLARDARRLDFDTTVQWRERHALLKVAFPVDVLSPTATYEIQWGNVERPTHRNKSWDWAQFEVAAQKWADLSEGGYGVSLLNDCKYGYDIHDGVLRLTLLRGTTEPDPVADLGEHRFAYSLLPHQGRWGHETIAEAYALNDPLWVWAAPRGAGVAAPRGAGAAAPRGTGAAALLPQAAPMPVSFVQVDRPHVVIETVKQAQDGRGLIVRLYECQRQRGPCRLTMSLPLTGAWRTNLLEEDQEELACKGQSVEFSVRPYQILTLRLLPCGS